jgi:hypothetical protein
MLEVKYPRKIAKRLCDILRKKNVTPTRDNQLKIFKKASFSIFSTGRKKTLKNSAKFTKMEWKRKRNNKVSDS